MLRSVITVLLFINFQEGREEPNSLSAMTVTATEESIEWSDRYSHGPQVTAYVILFIPPGA